MPNRTISAYLTLAVLWGSGFSLIKIGLEGLTPAQLVLVRLALGAVVLLGVARLRRVRLPGSARLWALVTLAGLLGNVIPFLLLSYGEQTASAGVAGTMMGATPLLTLGLAAVALSERLGGRQVAGMTAGFAGVVLVIAPWQGESGSRLGALLCFGAAASYAAGFVAARRFLSGSGLAPLSLAAGQLLSATVVQTALTPLTEWRDPVPSVAVVAAVGALGLAGTGFGYVLYFQLIERLGATRAASVNYLVPVVAVLVGVAVLGEPVTWHLVIGGAVVLGGVALTHQSPRINRPVPTGRRSHHEHAT